jgi:hypothetical protein
LLLEILSSINLDVALLAIIMLETDDQRGIAPFMPSTHLLTGS